MGRGGPPEGLEMKARLAPRPREGKPGAAGVWSKETRSKRRGSKGEEAKKELSSSLPDPPSPLQPGPALQSLSTLRADQQDGSRRPILQMRKLRLREAQTLA